VLKRAVRSESGLLSEELARECGHVDATGSRDFSKMTKHHRSIWCAEDNFGSYFKTPQGGWRQGAEPQGSPRAALVMGEDDLVHNDQGISPGSGAYRFGR